MLKNLFNVVASASVSCFCEMGQVFNVNITYEIISIDDWKVEIQDIKSKTFMTNTTTLDKHFIHAYCATCHSSQGASINKSITTHE